MIELRDEAYVLRTHPLGEADLIVSLLARDHGKVRGVARAARKSRRRFGGMLEPLTRLTILWSERPGRELQRLDGAECARSFAAMQGDPLLQAACAVVAEVTEAFAHEGEAEPRTFRLLGAVLEALEAGAEPLGTLRYFEAWMLRIHGLLPDLEHCATCGEELAGRKHGPRIERGAGLVCERCAARAGGGGPRLEPAALEFLEATRRLGPGSIASRPPAGGPGEALELLLRGTLESFAERRFRAYRHLEAALGGGTGR